MLARRFFFLCLFSISGLGGIQSASAEYPENYYGWYEAGAAVVDDAELEDFFGNAIDGNTVEFDTGFHFGIAMGRKLTRYVKIEAESGFNYNSLSSIEGATASSGNLYRVPVLGNLVLQFPNRTGLVPVIGAGAGAQWSSFDAQNIVLGTTTLDDYDQTWAFSYQGYAGVRYELNPRMSLGVFYHYSVVDGPSWEFDSDDGGNLKLDSIRTHTLSLTFAWEF
jgi:opacity protein-like surface antigen